MDVDDGKCTPGVYVNCHTCDICCLSFDTHIVNAITRTSFSLDMEMNVPILRAECHFGRNSIRLRFLIVNVNALLKIPIPRDGSAYFRFLSRHSSRYHSFLVVNPIHPKPHSGKGSRVHTRRRRRRRCPWLKVGLTPTHFGHAAPFLSHLVTSQEHVHFKRHQRFDFADGSIGIFPKRLRFYRRVRLVASRENCRVKLG